MTQDSILVSELVNCMEKKESLEEQNLSRKTLIKLNLHGNSVLLLAIAMPGPNYNLAETDTVAVHS